MAGSQVSHEANEGDVAQASGRDAVGVARDKLICLYAGEWWGMVARRHLVIILFFLA